MPTVSKESLISRVLFVFKSRQIQSKHGPSAPFNKLPAKLACSSRTGEYCPKVLFVLPRLRANIPQCGPRARLVRDYRSFQIENPVFSDLVTI